MGRESNKTQSLRGMNYLNSKWNQQNKGLPSPAQIYEWMSAAEAYNIGDEFKYIYPHLNGNIWDFSESGFKKYIAIQYRIFMVWLANNWEYNEKMTDDLDLDKFEIERFLFDDTKALIKDNGKYFLLSYQPDWNGEDPEDRLDQYGRPTKIMLAGNINAYWNNKILENTDTEITFIPMKNNPLEWNKIIENSSWFHLAYEIMCMYNDNVYIAQDKYMLLFNPKFDPNAGITANALNDWLVSRKNLTTFSPQGQKANEDGSDPADPMNNNLFEDFKNALQKLEFKDRQDVLYSAYEDIMSQAYETLGIPINKNSKKKERQISGEIEVQEAIPDSQRMGMFLCRKYAIDKANKVWGTTWEITLNEKEVEEQEDNEDSKGEQPNE